MFIHIYTPFLITPQWKSLKIIITTQIYTVSTLKQPQATMLFEDFQCSRQNSSNLVVDNPPMCGFGMTLSISPSGCEEVWKLWIHIVFRCIDGPSGDVQQGKNRKHDTRDLDNVETWQLAEPNLVSPCL